VLEYSADRRPRACGCASQLVRKYLKFLMVMQSCHTYDDVIRSIDYMAIGITSTLGIHHVIGW